MPAKSRGFDRSVQHQRKFIMSADAGLLAPIVSEREIEQGYLWMEDQWEVRVRRTRVAPDSPGFIGEVPPLLTLKGPGQGFSKSEYSVEISAPDAVELLARSDLKISKTRRQYVDPATDISWNLDQFHGDNEGLWIAEVELLDAERLAAVRPPSWATGEVTLLRRFRNSALARKPFTRWPPARQRP